MSRFRTFVARVGRRFRSVAAVTTARPDASSQSDSPPDGENVTPDDTQSVPRTARARASVSLYVALFGAPIDKIDAKTENDTTDAADTARD